MFKLNPTRLSPLLLSRPLLPKPHPHPHPRPFQPSTRIFHTPSHRLNPRADSQDKDSINTEATEYSKSGTDDQAARESDAAFDPGVTNPEAEQGKAGEGHEGKNDGANPLDVSPANPEVSKGRGGTEGGAENNKGDGRGRENASGGGRGAKHWKTGR